MNNIKLLSSILNRTNDLIKSDEYKEAYRIENSFSRKIKLSFANTVYFICSSLRKSLSSEINNFIEEHSYLEFPNISKQAFSKARQNISKEVFKELCRVFVDSFYDSNLYLKKWRGFNVFAVDGTTIQVPDTSENIEYFDVVKNQSATKTALASASALYDVLNDVVIDSIITQYKTSEKEMAKQHINSINSGKLLDDSIVIFDRGYPSYEMFNFLEAEGLFFLMRVSSSFTKTSAINSNDGTLNYKFGVELKKVRVIKIKLSDGSIEVLLTNIFDEAITPSLFMELYFLRWGVESKFKELKSSIEIEEFSGTKPIAIEQDFYASTYLSMIASLIKKDADAAIANDNQYKNLKSEYQANRNFILSEVFKKIIHMLIKPISRMRILASLMEKAKKYVHKYAQTVLVNEKISTQGKIIIPKGNLAYNLIKTKYFHETHFCQWAY